MRMFNPAALAIAAFLLGLASASARDDGQEACRSPWTPGGDLEVGTKEQLRRGRPYEQRPMMMT